MTAIKTPNSRRNLDEAIKRAFGVQASGLDVLPTAGDAVAWANELVAAIDAAR